MGERLQGLQLPLYLAALVVGAGIGVAMPAFGTHAETLLWPALALLIYATFTQLRLADLARAARDRRFAAALLLANFVAVPVLVVVLTLPVRGEPALLVGCLLVLLAPCTDWFVPFARAGGGDAARAATATPLLLIGQLVTLPLFLSVLLGSEGAAIVRARPFLEAFAGLILLPLLAAALTGLIARRHRPARRAIGALAAVPTPALALVLALVAISQADALRGSGRELVLAGAIFVAYAALVPLLGRSIATRARLAPPAARTLVFSVGTRNSFVVLPLALALPEGAALAAAAVVTQTLVELAAMSGYVRVIPGLVVPDTRARSVPRR